MESGLDGLARKGCFWTDVSERVWEDSSQTLALHHRLPKLFMAPAVAIFLPNASPSNQIIFYLVYSAPVPDQVSRPHSPVLLNRTSKSSLMCILSWVGMLTQGQNLPAGSPLQSRGVVGQEAPEEQGWTRTV